MSVARDAITKASATFTTGTTVAHTPVGTPAGVLLWIVQNGSATDETPAATYGGVSMDVIAFAADTATEPMAAYLLFLGSNIPTGAQNCVISSMAGATKMAWVETLTAAADTEVEDSGVAQNDQANPAVSLTTGASVETYVASVIMSGAGTQGAITAPSSPAGSKLDNHDFGQQVAVLGDLDANDAGGGVTFTWTAGSDDVAMIAVAVKEAAGTPAATASATLTVDLAFTAAATPKAYASATLPVVLGFSANAVVPGGAATASATLAIDLAFQAAATPKAYASGALPLDLAFQAAATPKAYASAALPLGLNFQAAAIPKAYAAATLTVDLGFSAAGTSRARAAGALQVDLGFSAAATPRAYAAGTLQVNLGFSAAYFNPNLPRLTPRTESTLTLTGLPETDLGGL